MARSINKVILVGNLTRDPELKYTPNGHAVCTFGIATNREWVSDGERKESADFHNIVAWNKLGELCSQLLSKGDKAYVEGRLQTRSWDGDDGKKRYMTEVIIDEMVVLNSKGGSNGGGNLDSSQTDEIDFEEVGEESQDASPEEADESEDVSADEIPF